MHMYLWVLVKENYVKEDAHEILCVCPSKETAKDYQTNFQNKYDPDYNEWKIEMYKTEVLS